MGDILPDDRAVASPGFRRLAAGARSRTQGEAEHGAADGDPDPQHLPPVGRRAGR